MQNFTGVQFKRSEQHKDRNKECSATRYPRDYNDALKILRYLEARNPFEGHPDLVSIETGEVGDDNVNVHKAKAIGDGIITSIVNPDVLFLRRKIWR